MVDREMVIKELARCVNHDRECEKCFYRNETFCTDVLMYDALELLKEQEPVEPSVDVDTYVCPNCGHRLEHQGMLGDNVIFDERYNFCPACGKAVKWDD